MLFEACEIFVAKVSRGGAGGGVCKSGNLEILEFGVQKIKNKIRILKIQIRSAQNVGKVWISRKKTSRPYLGPSEAIFSIGRKNRKIVKILPIFLGGPMGPYLPGLGPCCYPPEVGE